MIVVLIILLILELLLNVYLFSLTKDRVQRDQATASENAVWEHKLEDAKKQVSDKYKELATIHGDIERKHLYLEELDNNQKVKIKEIKEEYNQQEKEIEEDFEQIKGQIEKTFENDIKIIKKDYLKLKDIVDAATESMRLQQAESEKQKFYMLDVSEVDKKDFQLLSTWKTQLAQPRVLSMLLWQTYIQKPLKVLTSRVLKDQDVTGIYKITHVPSGMCYIGQAVSVKTRWQDHCKCGCGVDAPAANKLYNAMQKYGIWEFSFELLESCKKEELNEKEATYIKLFDSVNNGFNTSNGIGKPMEL